MKKPESSPASKNSKINKPAFYNRVLDEAEKLDFETACGIEGIDNEIALLRVKIKSALEKEPDNLKLIMQAAETLAKLVKTRYSITREQKKGLKEAVNTVIRDIAVPLGIAILQK